MMVRVGTLRCVKPRTFLYKASRCLQATCGFGHAGSERGFMDARQIHIDGRLVDLRSDTITKPSANMRAAMAEADVGDDVFGDDPTVIKLETYVAELFGKEAALFVPSGTMANLLSVMAHTWERGSEYIVGDKSHIYIWEQGGPAQFGGAHPRTVRNQRDGTLNLKDVEKSINFDDPHFPATKLVCLEDAYNGQVLPLDYINAVASLAHKHGLQLHLDGARIWNAIVSSGIEGCQRALHVDSLSVCLSKGLGAPMGSLVVGTSSFVARCRRLRKGLGGGLRQVGVVAAAGLYALEHNFCRLEEDHVNALQLAEGLNQLSCLDVNMASVQTNMVFVQLAASAKMSAPVLEQRLSESGVLCCALSDRQIRLVTSLEVDGLSIERTVQAFAQAL